MSPAPLFLDSPPFQFPVSIDFKACCPLRPEPREREAQRETTIGGKGRAKGGGNRDDLAFDPTECCIDGIADLTRTLLAVAGLVKNGRLR